jgi:hypothetical protein
MNAGTENGASDTLKLRRVLFVLVLLFMLSVNPAPNMLALRVEPVTIEYVAPSRRRRRRRYGRTLYPAFVTRES